jgi:hypothetical protein
MKVIFKISFVLVLLIGTTQIGSAQDPCMEELKGYYSKMKTFTINSFTSGKTTYMDYAIRMIPVDKKDKEQYSTMQIWVNNKDSKLINDKMQVLKNEKEAFTILPEQHMIVISDAVPVKKDYSSNNMLWIKLQDTLFMMSSIEECTKYTSKSGEAMKRITLALNSKGEQMFSVSSIVFNISEQAGEIREMKIVYASEKGKDYGGVSFASMDIVIQSMKVMEGFKIFSGNIESSVFNSGHGLKPVYAGYKVIDKRVKGKTRNG